MDYLKSTSLKQLERMYKQEKDPKVKTKLLVVIHKKEKKEDKEISKSFKISISTITRTTRDFRKHGKQGLYRKPTTRKYGYLKDNQKKQLINFIEETCPTSRTVNQFIQENFRKSYHPFSIPRLMKSIGFSRITPRKQHYKSDKVKQEEWKQVFKKRQNKKWIWVTKSSSKTNQ